MKPDGLFNRWHKGALATAVLCLSFGMNVLLTVQLKKVRAQTTRQDPLIGLAVSSFEAQDLRGKHVTVNLSRKSDTVVYVFTPSCGWCARNISRILSLSQKVSGKYDLIGISLSANDLPEYIVENRLTFPVYTSLDSQVVLKLRLGITPQTMVISHEGRIIKNWVGAYVGPIEKEISSYFKLDSL